MSRRGIERHDTRGCRIDSNTPPPPGPEAVPMDVDDVVLDPHDTGNDQMPDALAEALANALEDNGSDDPADNDDGDEPPDPRLQDINSSE